MPLEGRNLTARGEMGIGEELGVWPARVHVSFSRSKRVLKNVNRRFGRLGVKMEWRGKDRKSETRI
jgi:hypothetical protein